MGESQGEERTRCSFGGFVCVVGDMLLEVQIEVAWYTSLPDREGELYGHPSLFQYVSLYSLICPATLRQAGERTLL